VDTTLKRLVKHQHPAVSNMLSFLSVCVLPAHSALRDCCSTITAENAATTAQTIKYTSWSRNRNVIVSETTATTTQTITRTSWSKHATVSACPLLAASTIGVCLRAFKRFIRRSTLRGGGEPWRVAPWLASPPRLCVCAHVSVSVFFRVLGCVVWGV